MSQEDIDDLYNRPKPTKKRKKSKNSKDQRWSAYFHTDVICENVTYAVMQQRIKEIDIKGFENYLKKVKV